MFRGLNRYMCQVLDELRDITKVSGLTKREQNLILSLVEEIQVMGNRMEAKLNDVKDLHDIHVVLSNKRKELKELQKEIKESGGKPRGSFLEDS